MPLKLAFVFHFNQHTSEFASIASRACYRGLLNVLRAHPALPINVHLSGTLLRALNWVDGQVVDRVHEGVRAGQFELLGSTHAQNVPFASEDADNRRQIEVHARLLKTLFGTTPSTFWNAERSWRQSLVPVIARAGYVRTLIEDHHLHAAGVTAPIPVRTKFEGHSLDLLWDDRTLRERFNHAVWFGRFAQLWRYLDTLVTAAGDATHWVCYAEDAEAHGLWGWEERRLPVAHWANLDRLLTEFEQRGYHWHTLSEAKAEAEVGPLPDGAAGWMDRALNRPGARFHEDGYRDYFDFLQRSDKIRHFGKLYAVMRATLKPLENGKPKVKARAAKASARFKQIADETFCSHQYEFGCIGVGGRGYWGWENVRATAVYARLAQLALDPQPRRWIEDLNGDGCDELLWTDGAQLAIFSGFGGRLLGWFDLRQGRSWVGNPLAIPLGRYAEGASLHPEVKPSPARWLPESFTPDLKPFKDLKRKLPLNDVLGPDMDRELFPDVGADVIVYDCPPDPNGQWVPAPIQTGCLNDAWRVEGGTDGAMAADHYIDYRFETDTITFVNAVLPGLTITKQVRLGRHGIELSYTARNTLTRRRRLSWRWSHELSPDYAEVLDHGRQALAGEPGGVRNTVTGAAISVEASVPWHTTAIEPGLLALHWHGRHDFELTARGEVEWTAALKSPL